MPLLVWHAAKRVVVHEQNQDGGIRQRFLQLRLACTALAQLVGQFVDERLDHLDAVRIRVREPLGDFQRGAFPQIIHIGLERKAETENLAVRIGFDHGHRLLEYIIGLAVVDLARSADEPRLMRRGVDDEPRIDRDAMTTDARTGFQDVHPRMTVREFDHVPHVHVHMIANERQFVCECDVSVAKGVFRELHHLGGARMGFETLAANEQFVETPCLRRAGWREAADAAVVLHELDEYPPRQHPFRTIGDRDIGLPAVSVESRKVQIRPQPGQKIAHFLRRADGAGGFEDDETVAVEMRRDQSRRRKDMIDDRLLVA